MGLVPHPPPGIFKGPAKAWRQRTVKHKELFSLTVVIHLLHGLLPGYPALSPVDASLCVSLLTGARRADLVKSTLVPTGDLELHLHIPESKHHATGRVVSIPLAVAKIWNTAKMANFPRSDEFTLHSGRVTWSSLAGVCGLPHALIGARLGHHGLSTLSPYIRPLSESAMRDFMETPAIPALIRQFIFTREELSHLPAAVSITHPFQ